MRFNRFVPAVVLLLPAVALNSVLNAGEKTHVEIVLPPESFSYWNPSKKDWTTDTNNTFTIEAGFSERDLKAKGQLVLN